MSDEIKDRVPSPSPLAAHALPSKSEACPAQQHGWAGCHRKLLADPLGITSLWYTAVAIRHCVQNRVRGIDHGNSIDAATARLCAEKGVLLTPAVVTYATMADSKWKGFSPASRASRSRPRRAWSCATARPKYLGTAQLGEVLQDVTVFDQPEQSVLGIIKQGQVYLQKSLGGPLVEDVGSQPVV
ncbi:hypothetical protein F4775DRAFT_592330 [Biscogniauxia sp. FL1348]|nr:hypothetical protein F4775DRAFT_592330 [Biscogniauxia sp. FL1348]